jgi:hypothetical protein
MEASRVGVVGNGNRAAADDVRDVALEGDAL